MPFDPRTGKCQRCEKKIGDPYLDHKGRERIVKRTHIHHIEYHEDIMESTIELCTSCHSYESWKTRKRQPKDIQGHFLPYG